MDANFDEIPPPRRNYKEYRTLNSSIHPHLICKPRLSWPIVWMWHSRFTRFSNQIETVFEHWDSKEDYLDSRYSRYNTQGGSKLSLTNILIMGIEEEISKQVRIAFVEKQNNWARSIWQLCKIEEFEEESQLVLLQLLAVEEIKKLVET